MEVAQETLDVAGRPTAETWQVAKAAAEMRPLVAPRGAMAPAWVVLEATGGFAGPLLAAWAVATLPVGRATPRPGRALAPAVGSVAQTDRMEARGLAHCAAAVNPVPRPLPEAATHERRALLLRRRHVVARRTAARHRLGTGPPRMPQALAQPIAWWAGPRSRLEADWTRARQRRAVGQAPAAILHSLPGVGPGLSRTLLGQVPA
jgi:transposase